MKMSWFYLGALAAIGMTTVEYVGRFTLGMPLIPELMAQRLFAWVPIDIFEFGITLFGTKAKWLAFASMFPLHWLVGGILALLLGALSIVRVHLQRVAGWLLLSAVLTLTWMFVALPTLGQTPYSVYPPGASPVPVPLALFAYSLVFTGILTLGIRTVRWFEEPADRSSDHRHGISNEGERGVRTHKAANAPEEPPVSSRPLSRRSFLSIVAGTMVVVTASGTFSKAFGALKDAATTVLSYIKEIVPVITPNNAFYKISKNLFDPKVDAKTWRLDVSGAVEAPYSLEYPDLKSFPVKSEYVTLCCISNEVGGDLISNALWEGVQLGDLLQKAKLLDGVVDIKLTAHDGYTESIPIHKALDPGTLVAWNMNGEPLPWDHGAPARLIVPGIYGMKNVKWLTGIEAITSDFKGFWEHRGWSDEAVIKTMSRIDTPHNGQRVGPGPLKIGGVAFAGDRGISSVEVSFDEGRSWHVAETSEPPSRYAWVHWGLSWTPREAGHHTITVRATDGTGTPQPKQETSAAPAGASGWHSVSITWQNA